MSDLAGQVQHKSIAQMTGEILDVCHAKGWYDHPVSFGEAIALLHSEVSEAFEAWRRWGTGDATGADGKPKESAASSPTCSSGYSTIARDLTSIWKPSMSARWPITAPVHTGTETGDHDRPACIHADAASAPPPCARTSNDPSVLESRARLSSRALRSEPTQRHSSATFLKVYIKCRRFLSRLFSGYLRICRRRTLTVFRSTYFLAPGILKFSSVTIP